MCGFLTLIVLCHSDGIPWNVFDVHASIDTMLSVCSIRSSRPWMCCLLFRADDVSSSSNNSETCFCPLWRVSYLLWGFYFTSELYTLLIRDELMSAAFGDFNLVYSPSTKLLSFSSITACLLEFMSIVIFPSLTETLLIDSDYFEQGLILGSRKEGTVFDFCRGMLSYLLRLKRLLTFRLGFDLHAYPFIIWSLWISACLWRMFLEAQILRG